MFVSHYYVTLIIIIYLYQKCKYIIDKNNRVRAFMLGITHGFAVCLCYIFLKYAYEKLIQISIKQNRVICIKNINDSYKTNRRDTATYVAITFNFRQSRKVEYEFEHLCLDSHWRSRVLVLHISKTYITISIQIQNVKNKKNNTFITLVQ